MPPVAPVLIKERMTHGEFMDWCDEDTKADLIEGVIVVQPPAFTSHERLFKFLMRPPLLEALFCGTIPRAFELDCRRSS
jgi:hypothetical protein